jgi:lipooligosaccharide transport system permease protein
MMSASFESMYSSFSRMHVQRTWDAIMNAPVMLDDVVFGEAIWAASKAFMSGAAVLIVAAALGLVASPLALWVLPIVFITGLAFAGMGLIMTSLSPSYDFFMYYFTLGVTPMMLVSGVFFPLNQLPPWLQTAAHALPLTHAVALVRPLMNGAVPQFVGAHVLVLLTYAAVSCYVALVLARRRLLK